LPVPAPHRPQPRVPYGFEVVDDASELAYEIRGAHGTVVFLEGAPIGHSRDGATGVSREDEEDIFVARVDYFFRYISTCRSPRRFFHFHLPTGI